MLQNQGLVSVNVAPPLDQTGFTYTVYVPVTGSVWPLREAFPHVLVQASVVPSGFRMLKENTALRRNL